MAGPLSRCGGPATQPGHRPPWSAHHAAVSGCQQRRRSRLHPAELPLYGQVLSPQPRYPVRRGPLRFPRRLGRRGRLQLTERPQEQRAEVAERVRRIPRPGRSPRRTGGPAAQPRRPARRASAPQATPRRPGPAGRPPAAVTGRRPAAARRPGARGGGAFARLTCSRGDYDAGRASRRVTVTHAQGPKRRSRGPVFERRASHVTRCDHPEGGTTGAIPGRPGFGVDIVPGQRLTSESAACVAGLPVRYAARAPLRSVT